MPTEIPWITKTQTVGVVKSPTSSRITWTNP